MSPRLPVSANRSLVIGILLVVVFLAAGYGLMGQEAFVRTSLSGLTLGSLYFMVAAGLTLIFGLMDVLNFAHGAMFMVGAYLGWQFYTNPSFIFALLPLVGAAGCGLVASPLLRSWTIHWRITPAWQERLPLLLTVFGLVIIVAGLWGLPFLDLSATAAVATNIGSTPLDEIKLQEPIGLFGLRLALVALGGLVAALGSSGPGDLSRVVSPRGLRRHWLTFGALLGLTLVLLLGREAIPVAVLQLNGNLRFALALLAGTLAGAGLGALVEVALIRPLYVRPIYQVMVTIGLGYMLRELVLLLWKPVPYQMVRPPLFAQPGEAASVLEWLSKGSSTLDVFGVTFPTYRLFIILLGVVMLVVLTLTIGYSRLGMIIRAGVQDREMVEALGINVRQIFTVVFVIGVALAALGGIGAAPFIPIESGMGDLFQIQAFICVVIGGMGSFSGAGVGALLLGLARAFGDYLALQFGMSPAISEASTVIIMAIVLLVRPAGLFGRKE